MCGIIWLCRYLYTREDDQSVGSRSRSRIFVWFNSEHAICNLWKRQTRKGALRNALGEETDAWLNGYARTKGTAPEHPATGATEADMEAIAAKFEGRIGTLAARKEVTCFCQFYGMLRVSDLKHFEGRHVP
jgi:hypothetical protein